MLRRDLRLVGRDLRAVLSWGGRRRALIELPGAVSHAGPQDVRFVTDDIGRFWRAFDAAREGEPWSRAFERYYFAPGTPGLQEFRHRRPQGFARLPRTVRSRQAFYASIRSFTLGLQGEQSEQFWQEQSWQATVRRQFGKLQSWLPEARFPDVYLTLGGLFTGGTAGLSGIFVSAEFLSRDARPVLRGLNAWERGALRGVDGLPFLILHELVHCLQKRPNPNTTRRTLLALALEEGVPDFIASLVTGQAPDTPYVHYGLAHEGPVWRDFARAMHGSDTRQWLYQGSRALGRPADLGYFVGYRVAEQYYGRATDQRAALRELLDLQDPVALLRASGYRPH